MVNVGELQSIRKECLGIFVGLAPIMVANEGLFVGFPDCKNVMLSWW